MYVKLIGGFYELSVWIKNCRRENHFDIDCVKNKNKISTKQAKKKDYLLLF